MKKISHKLILDSILDGVFIIKDDILSYANSSLCKMIGYTEDEVVGQHFLRFVHEDDHLLVSNNRRNRMSGKETKLEYEFRLVHKNGSIVYIIISIAPLLKFEGGLAAIGTIKDVTGRVKSQIETSDIESQYKTLLELSPDPIIVSDLTGKIILHNQAAYNAHEPLNTSFKLIGNNVMDYIHDQNELNVVKNLIFDVECMPVAKYTVHFKTKKGRLIPYELHSNTVYNNNGEPKYTITIGRDISKIEDYENQLKKLIAEKETMIREIHHRIKNSLQQVHSLLGIQAENASFRYNLESKITPEIATCQSVLQKIISDARQRILSISLVHQMFYKQNSNKIEFSEFLRELINSIKLMYGRIDIPVDVTISGDKLELCLEHIIPCGLIANEIISNSFKHAFNGKKNGNIIVDIKQNASTNTLIISDDGIGIKENILKFNKGLGLSLIYGLTEQIGGKVDMQTNSNGTTYSIIFDKKYLKA